MREWLPVTQAPLRSKHNIINEIYIRLFYVAASSTGRACSLPDESVYISGQMKCRQVNRIKVMSRKEQNLMRLQKAHSVGVKDSTFSSHMLVPFQTILAVHIVFKCFEKLVGIRAQTIVPIPILSISKPFRFRW